MAQSALRYLGQRRNASGGASQPSSFDVASGVATMAAATSIPLGAVSTSPIHGAIDFLTAFLEAKYIVAANVTENPAAALEGKDNS